MDNCNTKVNLTGTEKIKERILLKVNASQLSILVSIKWYLMLQLFKTTNVTLIMPKWVSEISRAITRNAVPSLFGNNVDKENICRAKVAILDRYRYENSNSYCILTICSSLTESTVGIWSEA